MSQTSQPSTSRPQTTPLSPSTIETLAGFSAGIVSTLAVHPFDVVKTRLQIERDSHALRGGSLRVFRKIAHEGAGSSSAADGSGAGVVRAFYRGLLPNLIGNSVSWALYFMWYGKIKDMIRDVRASEEPQLRSADYFLASGLSGILTAILTNPIWVIKTRMLSTARHSPGAYRSVVHGMSDLYQHEGFRGFYRGLIPSLFGVSHGAIQFVAYEQLKNHWARSRPEGRLGLTNLDYLLLSAASKVFAGSITYPYQVVRARLQTYDAQARYGGAWDVVTQVMKREGVGGFYKGLGPNVLRVLPSTCVTFLVYENVKFYLPKAWIAS